MKQRTVVLACILGVSALFSAGCVGPGNTTRARELGVIDTLPDSQAKGYVEFSTKSANGLIPIYLIDEGNQSHLLAAVGVEKGQKYVRRQGMKASERLRVAAPPGNHRFALQKDGELITVPVQAGKITQVELKYDPIENAQSYAVYRMEHTILDPVNAPEAVGGSSRSE
jgi:hypothetical protein